MRAKRSSDNGSSGSRTRGGSGDYRYTNKEVKCNPQACAGNDRKCAVSEVETPTFVTAEKGSLMREKREPAGSDESNPKVVA